MFCRFMGIEINHIGRLGTGRFGGGDRPPLMQTVKAAMRALLKRSDCLEDFSDLLFLMIKQAGFLNSRINTRAAAFRAEANRMPNGFHVG